MTTDPIDPPDSWDLATALGYATEEREQFAATGHDPSRVLHAGWLVPLEREIERLTSCFEGARREWEVAAGERDRLRAALISARAILAASERGATHWGGCESQHPACAAMKVIDGALAGESNG